MPIKFIADKNMWIIETKKTSYALKVDEKGKVQNMHWGAKLPLVSDYMFADPINISWSSQETIHDIVGQEYTPWGGFNYVEPSLKVVFHDGVRDLILQYTDYELLQGDIPELIITMQDPHYKLQVKVHYKVFEEVDLIERHAEIINLGSEEVSLESVQSAVWYIPNGYNYRFTHLAGRWAQETMLNETILTPGKKVIESRRGNTSNHANPWFAIDKGTSDEESGNVWFGQLGWSGNWKITAELTTYNLLRITGGINDFDFKWQLTAGESFITPVFTAGFSSNGFGEASRNLHEYQLKYILPKDHSSELRKVLYNSWEATYFDVTEKGQIELAEKAASIGVELFVVDDGWFGERNNDTAGLGDWYVNKEKFPEGLTNLINKVKELGMDFGIWVEPEMVNPNSDLYRKHPDWVLNFPNRPRTEARNQLVLNLAKKEVKEYIFEFLDKLLGENDIRFIKWDMNRPFSEPGWMEAPENKQREVWVRYVHNLYEILDRLKIRYPYVVFESCSSGGGRVDIGVLKRTDQVWPSDNTNAVDRLLIQEGFSYAYCPQIMVSWVTDNSDYFLPLKFRFHSSMMGTLGIGANLKHWDEKQLEESKSFIALYKEIRHIVQKGDLYRLTSTRKESYSAVEYISKDKTEILLFTFSIKRPLSVQNPIIYLKGLDPDKTYCVEGVDRIVSGQYLMTQGLKVALYDAAASNLIRIKQLS